jgi:hypothetical protein
MARSVIPESYLHCSACHQEWPLADQAGDKLPNHSKCCHERLYIFTGPYHAPRAWDVPAVAALLMAVFIASLVLAVLLLAKV